MINRTHEKCIDISVSLWCTYISIYHVQPSVLDTTHEPRKRVKWAFSLNKKWPITQVRQQAFYIKVTLLYICLAKIIINTWISRELHTSMRMKQYLEVKQKQAKLIHMQPIVTTLSCVILQLHSHFTQQCDSGSRYKFENEKQMKRPNTG